MVKAQIVIIDSPIGDLLISADAEGLQEIRFATAIPPAQRRDPSLRRVARTGPVAETRRQLRAYFAGELTDFDLVLTPQGTEFQRRVWDALCKIPYGETISYGELARRIGNPKACRAVGAANGRNPIPIVVPCHRVIGGDGRLTGFGGGLSVKQQLLDHERKFAHTVAP